jgi:hypothetical protein
MRTLAMPKAAEPWSLTSLIKIGAKVVGHGGYVTFQMAEIRALRRWHRVNNQCSLDRRVLLFYFRLVCDGIQKMTNCHTQAGGR